jgi:hypothetical protein
MVCHNLIVVSFGGVHMPEMRITVVIVTDFKCGCGNEISNSYEDIGVGCMN